MNNIKLHRSHLLSYGVGSIGTGIFTTVPGMLLMFYMTNVLAIPAGKAAIAVFVPKMWDVISDPLFGIISDKTRSRWGRRPYLFFGAILTGLFFYLLFNVPLYDSVNERFWYVILLYILCATGYTIFSIPYIALPAEMTSNPNERTRIVSYRMVFLFIGIILAGGLSPFLIEYYGGGAQGYSVMALLLGGIICCAMLTSYFGLKGIKLLESEVSAFSFKSLIQGPFNNSTFVILFTAYAIQLVGIGCLLTGLPYFSLYVLNGSGMQLTIMFLVLNISAIIFVPVWLSLSIRIGKIKTFNIAGMIFILAMLTFWFYSSPSSIYMVYVATAFAGIGFAGQQIIGFALLPDLVDFDTSHGGPENMSGVYTGIWVAGEKTGFAFAAFMVGVIFSISGLVETSEGATQQTEWVLESIKFVTAVMPIILFTMGLLLIRVTRNSNLLLNQPS